MKVYEYLVVKEDWLYGDLSKGTRLYYDYDKGGYVYHYEREDTHNDNRYQSKSFTSTDYFISLKIAENGMIKDLISVGPELGEFETLNPIADVSV